MEICTDADIRYRVFTTDKNCTQARIADKTADMDFRQIILITVFYSIEERLCMTIPKKKMVLTIYFLKDYVRFFVFEFMYEWALRIATYIAGRVFQDRRSLPILGEIDINFLNRMLSK